MLKRNIKSKARKQKKGQSTVEYIILVAAVLAALIIFLRPDGVFQNSFNAVLQAQANEMNIMSQRLIGSHNSG